MNQLPLWQDHKHNFPNLFVQLSDCNLKSDNSQPSLLSITCVHFLNQLLIHCYLINNQLLKYFLLFSHCRCNCVAHNRFLLQLLVSRLELLSGFSWTWHDSDTHTCERTDAHTHTQSALIPSRTSSQTQRPSLSNQSKGRYNLRVSFALCSDPPLYYK